MREVSIRAVGNSLFSGASRGIFLLNLKASSVSPVEVSMLPERVARCPAPCAIPSK